MKSPCFLFIVLFFSAGSLLAQPPQNTAAKEAEYTHTINSRAQKIVTALTIHDSPKSLRVQTIIANQYRKLNDIHTFRDGQIKEIKLSGDAKEIVESKIKSVQDEAANKITLLHKDYLTQLSAELSTNQVDKVKDGMTYNVVNLTYNGYLDMLPKLTAEQKIQIMAWLVEAREHAMDAETSDKKHGWFGKYKGRINNYLSAAGYDLKKEGEAWQKRIKEREKNNTTTN